MNQQLAQSKERAVTALSQKLMQMTGLHPEDGRLLAELALNLACAANVTTLPEQKELVAGGVKQARTLLRRATKASDEAVRQLDKKYPGWSFATAKQVTEGFSSVPTGD